MNTKKVELTEDELDNVVGGMLEWKGKTVGIYGTDIVYSYINGHTYADTKAEVDANCFGWSDEGKLNYLKANGFIG